MVLYRDGFDDYRFLPHPDVTQPAPTKFIPWLIDLHGSSAISRLMGYIGKGAMIAPLQSGIPHALGYRYTVAKSLTLLSREDIKDSKGLTNLSMP